MSSFPLVLAHLISIHAPSRERLFRHAAAAQAEENFNPRSLAGATSAPIPGFKELPTFQSTLPRGSDSYAAIYTFCHRISIHAPSRERLYGTGSYRQRPYKFQSTLPRGSDWHFGCGKTAVWHISIHAPSRERLLQHRPHLLHLRISIHAPSRERLAHTLQQCAHLEISIHAPSRERLADEAVVVNDCSISIHAPSRERRFDCFPFVDFLLISIHAPSRERL